MDIITTCRELLAIEQELPSQVYFGGKYAYSVSIEDKQFMKDVRNRRVADCCKAMRTYNGFSRN